MLNPTKTLRKINSFWIYHGSWPSHNQQQSITRAASFSMATTWYDWFFYAVNLRWQLIKSSIVYFNSHHHLLVKMHGGVYSSLNNVKSVTTLNCSYSILLIEFSSISVRVWNIFQQIPYHTLTHSPTHRTIIRMFGLCWSVEYKMIC